MCKDLCKFREHNARANRINTHTAWRSKFYYSFNAADETTSAKNRPAIFIMPSSGYSVTSYYSLVGKRVEFIV